MTVHIQVSMVKYVQIDRKSHGNSDSITFEMRLQIAT